MNFPTLKGFNIPEGRVVKVLVDGAPLWEVADEPVEPIQQFKYVSFGDSIAAGHLINNEWHDPPYYGHQSQYGQPYANPDGSTVIVENTYTDFIRKYLYGIYGEDNVSAKSFARSGSRVYKPDGADRENQSLTSVVEHEIVKQAIREADLITICIGANDILEPATGKYLEPYLTEGLDLAPLEAEVEDSLRILEDNDHPYSYWTLFEKINKLIKPNTKVVFTTIYNPLKYLYIEKGTWDNDYKDGLFGVWLDTIPDLSLLGRPDWIDFDKLLKKEIVNTPAFTRLCDRINVLGEWAEKYIDTSGTSVNGKAWKGLNHIIRNKVKEYQAVNPNFIVAETHKLYDSIPDRLGSGELHYNDLVNCQITKGFDANNLGWYRLWGDAEGNTASEKIKNYWTDIIERHFSEIIVGNVNGIAEEIMPDVLWLVLYTAVDVHPRADGHYVMYRSFVDTLGWNSLYTIDYDANGGTGTMTTQKVLDASIVNGVSKKIYSIIKANTFIPQAHHHFTSWKSNNGNSYSNEQAIYVPANITLSAQWEINKRKLTVVQGADELSYTRLFSRDYPNRQLYISGYSSSPNSNKATWNRIFANTETFEVAYGQPIKMVVKGNVEWLTGLHLGNAPKPNCSISQYVGGTTYEPKVTAKVAEASFTMPDRDITIEYHFKYGANSTTIYPSPYSHSYWLGYIGDKDLTVTYSGRDS